MPFAGAMAPATCQQHFLQCHRNHINHCRQPPGQNAAVAQRQLYRHFFRPGFNLLFSWRILFIYSMRCPFIKQVTAGEAADSVKEQEVHIPLHLACRCSPGPISSSGRPCIRYARRFSAVSRCPEIGSRTKSEMMRATRTEEAEIIAST